MIASLAAILVFAQLSAPAASAPPTLEEDRLRACLDQARSDPAAAIGTASQWLEGISGAERSFPQQCLGFAYMGLLRWDAALGAFTSARDIRAATDLAARARLGGMAGNAALAASRFDEAIDLLAQAQADAAASGDGALAGENAADRARALVALGRNEEGALALADARTLAPQDAAIWLLSATLARRMEDLENAGQWITTASLLEPANPAIGLEAGLISAMSGRDDAARNSWQSVIDTAPGTP